MKFGVRAEQAQGRLVDSFCSVSGFAQKDRGLARKLLADFLVAKVAAGGRLLCG